MRHLGIIVKKKNVLSNGLPCPLVTCSGKALVFGVENRLQPARFPFLAEEGSSAVCRAVIHDDHLMGHVPRVHPDGFKTSAGHCKFVVRRDNDGNIGPGGSLNTSNQTAEDSAFRIPRSEINQPTTNNRLLTTSNQLPPLRVIGQIGAMYIITEGPEGMYLIDQHAAHERVLYEKFMAEKAALHLAVQQLLDPIPLEFSPDESALLEEHHEVLSAIGFTAGTIRQHDVARPQYPGVAHQ